MSKVFDEPESLTVVKLKRELTKHGVPLPLKGLKADYVQLYRDEVLGKQEEDSAMREVQQHEASFSIELNVEYKDTIEPEEQGQVVKALADSTISGIGRRVKHAKRPSIYNGIVRENEEENDGNSEESSEEYQEKERPPTRRSVRLSHQEVQADIKPTENSPQPELDSDFSYLTNTELMAKLKMYGIKSGPIAPSTRKMYEKKLAKFLHEVSMGDASVLNISQQTSFANESEEDAEQNHSFNTPIAPKQSSTRKRITQQEVKETTTTTTSTTVKETSATKSESKARCWLSTSVKILLVALAFGFLLYIILQTMESWPKNPIKRLMG